MAQNHNQKPDVKVVDVLKFNMQDFRVLVLCEVMVLVCSYVGVIWFVIHVLQLLPIRFTQ